MDRRENALYEALIKNEGETEKWLKHKTDLEDAIRNLENFRKKISVEVMVPIGNKAFMPGYLVHTNEVLVSHFGKMFSKCTSHQAQTICNNRIKVAGDYLSKLKTEKDMFMRNIEMPYAYGAMPDEGQEITEEYNEEREKLWKEQHKKNVRAQKLKERSSINGDVEKTHEDVIKRLEELEMMDELETELQELGVEDDDTLKMLMSGEIKITKEKERISLYNEEHKIETNGGNISFSEEFSNLSNLNLYTKYKTIKISDFERNSDSTNNNNIPNERDFNNSLNSTDSDVSSDTDSEIPQEFIDIRKEAEDIGSFRKKLSFVRKKIKLIEKEIDSMTISNPSDLDIKLNKIEVREYLLDYVLILEDEENASHDAAVIYDDNKDEKIVGEESEKKLKKTKRISFALEDDITYIDKNEKVENMLIAKHEQFEKDTIVLDREFQLKGKINFLSNEIYDDDKSQQNIIERVKGNLEYMQEQQSHEDFDLVSKILNSAQNINNTLQIKFKHSSSTYKYKNELDDNEIGSPADFHTMFGKQYPQNLKIFDFNNVNDEQKSNIESNNSKEKDNRKQTKEEKLYKDEAVKNSEFKNIKIKSEINLGQINKLKNQISMENELHTNIQTILKNKDSVKQEPHYKKEGQVKIKKKEEIIPRMTLGDVFENPTPQKVDDLPEGIFVNSHAPKKRISKFKQARTVPTT